MAGSRASRLPGETGFREPVESLEPRSRNLTREARFGGSRHLVSTDPLRLEEAFQRELDSLRADFGFPGATAAFALADGSVRGFATGLSDLESGAAMSPESRLLSASIGKTFVAATALALAGEGALSLDDRLQGWLGDQPWYPRLPNGSEITLRHLLSHSAGLADHVNDDRFLRELDRLRAGTDSERDEVIEPPQLISYVLDREPLFPVGEGYSYTDTGYILIGLVLERAARRPYYDQARERFLEPLGLSLTDPSDRRQLEGLVAGYMPSSNRPGVPDRITLDDGSLSFNPAIEWTGGGLVTNSQDLVRWAKALYEGRAVSGDYLEDLLESGYRGQDAEARYGLAVFLVDTPYGPSYGHGGWFPGYNSLLRYFPDHRIAVAIQVNRSYGNDRPLYVNRLMGALLAELGE